jgi:hypothetical protein
MGDLAHYWNSGKHAPVWVSMRIACLSAALAAVALPFAMAADDYASVRRKIDQIESGKLKPGARLDLTRAELAAYALHEIPEGMRNPEIATSDAGVTKASALVDFAKVRRSLGGDNSLVARLFEGERPVSVTARITSGDGKAMVDVERVEISGLVVEGAMLDFLIQHLLLPLYPDAAVGRPFELGHRIERLEPKPRGLGIVIGR